MQRIDEKNVQYYYLKDDGTFPNNASLPVLFFKRSLPTRFFSEPEELVKLLKLNQWENAWHDTVYDYHHYHSTAHEVLVALTGDTKIQLGGEKGIVLQVEKGDVLVIPAGVAHKNLEPQNDFSCVGAYPRGQMYDMNYGRIDEREQTDQNIEQVPLPASDPLFGTEGPVVKYWTRVLQASAR